MCPAWCCPRRPVKYMPSPGDGVTDDCEFLTHMAWVLQTEGLLAKDPRLLNHRAIFPASIGILLDLFYVHDYLLHVCRCIQCIQCS